MANLKARKATGKCTVCWQRITEETSMTRPTRFFQGELYHVECWEKRYKREKKAQGKKARTKRSF